MTLQLLHFWISLHMRKILFSFLSVNCPMSFSLFAFSPHSELPKPYWALYGIVKIQRKLKICHSTSRPQFCFITNELFVLKSLQFNFFPNWRFFCLDFNFFSLVLLICLFSKNSLFTFAVKFSIHLKYSSEEMLKIWSWNNSCCSLWGAYLTINVCSRRTGLASKVFHRSNHMYELKHFGMVWQRRIWEKCCGAQRKPYF